MNTMFQKKYPRKSRNGWIFLVVVFGVGLCMTEPIEAQYSMGYRGGRTGRSYTGRADQTEQKVTEALEKIETATMMILTDHLLQATPPPPAVLPKIQAIIDINEKYQGKFSKEGKINLYVLKSLFAYYSGNSQDAMNYAQRAYDLDPKNPDLSDLIIVLSLCYENYEKAKMVLDKREEVSSAILIKDISGSSESAKRNPGEPNIPGSNAKRPKEPNLAPAPRPVTPSEQPVKTPSSRWDLLLEPPPEKKVSRPSTTMPGKMPAKLSRPGPYKSRPPVPQRNYQTILNLPVEYMLSQELGNDFASRNLRSINGSVFPFASDQGRIFCALLWTTSGPRPQSTMPRSSRNRSTYGSFTTGTYTYTAEDYGVEEYIEEDMTPYIPRSQLSTMTRSGVSTPAREVSEVAFDLDTNIDQFRNLFLRHIHKGKMGFVGVNYDTSVFQVKQMLFEQPLPWPTCLKAELQQWPLPDITGAILLLVDTKGKIRYIGPVGGFLPQMLLDMELANATTMTSDIPDLPAMSRQSTSESSGTQKHNSTTKKGILRSIFGNRNNNKGSGSLGRAARTDSPREPNVPAREKPGFAPQTIPRQTPGTGFSSSPGGTLDDSNLQARKLLRAAQVQRKLSPLSALHSCDEVLERWPDSPEAQKAKVMIKSLLNHGRLPQNIKEERKQQGKYIGEE